MASPPATKVAANSTGSDSGQKPDLGVGLGLWSLIAFGGGIIGSEVFGLPTVMGSAAGPAFVLAIVFVGLVTIVLALIHAETGSAFPLAGGLRSIPRLALGDSAGFLVGWGSSPAGEVKNASKNITRTMSVTASKVVTLRTLVSLAFTGPNDWSGLGLSSGDWASIGGHSSPLSDVSKAAGYGLLAATVTAGSVTSTAGAGGGWVRFQGMVPYARAETGLSPTAPRVVGPLHGARLNASSFVWAHGSGARQKSVAQGK